MKRAGLAVVGLAVAAWAALPVETGAQGRVTITLASLAPEGSVWDLELKQMGSDWSKLSNGSVQLRVAPGGRLGSEASVIRQLRAGARPEAAALTTGLSNFDRGFSVFSLPFFFDSLDELTAVATALEPTLRARLDEQGVTLLAWGFGGWIHIFSRTPVASMADLKGVRLFTTAGDSLAENWYRRNGFNTVALTPTDVAVSLQNGAITAMPAPPYAALVFQWYQQTPHMLDLEVAPLLGGLVVNTRTWQRVPADVRAKLIDSARAMEGRLKTKIPVQDREAVKEMQARALKTVAPAPTFRKDAEALIDSMRGAWVPDDVYDLAVKARAAYRQARRP
ncbi:MAG TPA: TRAP transporter substrate-binding protein DctP [Vicinamibacterales bacterium]|nr:TRAP transporter substrate-binding protein DctP [Vicinamibacterales bacterium]